MRNAASVALRVDAYKAEIYSIGQASAKSSSQDASLKAELATLEAKLEASVAQLELTAASAAALRRECEALHTEQEASTQRTGALQSELMGALQSESESMHRIDALQLESAAYASEAKEWRDASSFAAATGSSAASCIITAAFDGTLADRAIITCTSFIATNCSGEPAGSAAASCIIAAALEGTLFGLWVIIKPDDAAASSFPKSAILAVFPADAATAAGVAISTAICCIAIFWRRCFSGE